MSQTNEFLSQEEVDALLSNVTGEREESGAPVVPDNGPREYDLTRQERVVRGRMATLESIHDRTGRALRQSLFSLLRKTVGLAQSGIKPIKHGEWAKQLPVPSSFNIVSIRPLRGSGVIVLEPQLVFMFVDSLFGGDGQIHARIEGRDFSMVEQSVIRRICQLIIDALGRSWAPVYDLKIDLVRSEMSALLAQIAAPGEICMASRFHIELGDKSAGFWICYPYSSLESIRDVLSNDLQTDADRSDARWGGLLNAQLMDAQADLRFEIGRAKISLQQALDLQPGSFFELDGDGSARVLCGGVELGKGVVGAQRGRYAVQMTSARRAPGGALPGDDARPGAAPPASYY